MIIRAEEINKDQLTKIGTFDELRHAFDHFMRFYSDKEKKESSEKILEDLKQSYYHIYRAGIDTLDLINIIYYDKIIFIIKRYCIEDINKAIPDYYPKLKPEIEQIKEDIASLRATKDSSKKENSIFKQYFQKIKRLEEIYKKISNSEVSLIEIRKKRIRESWLSIPTIIGFLSLGVSIIFYILTLLNISKSS